MAENEMKTRSIRADEDTLEKFKVLSEEFDNQGECLRGLINAYELNIAKKALPDMGRDIEHFESLLNSIQQAYMYALELNNNSEERIRLEFSMQLESKDKLIQQLQERSESAEMAVETIKSDSEAMIAEAQTELLQVRQSLKENEAEKSQLQENNEQLKKMIHDKETIIETMLARLPEQEKLASELENANGKIKEITSEKESISEELKKVKMENEYAKKIHQQEIKIAVSEIKEIYQQRIDVLNEAYRKKIEELQLKVDDLKTELSDTKELYQQKIDDLKEMQKVVQNEQLTKKGEAHGKKD